LLILTCSPQFDLSPKFLPVASRARQPELAPNFGPPGLGKFGFIEQPAGRSCRSRGRSHRPGGARRLRACWPWAMVAPGGARGGAGSARFGTAPMRPTVRIRCLRFQRLRARPRRLVWRFARSLSQSSSGGVGAASRSLGSRLAKRPGLPANRTAPGPMQRGRAGGRHRTPPAWAALFAGLEG
jgi:hypothetical protein